MNSELGEYGKDTKDFRLVQASGSKPLRPVWSDYVESDLPSNGTLGHLIWPAG
jgi:hypothetical protein